MLDGPRYPFSAFPTGWFSVAYSDELPPGAVKPLRTFGRDLVLFRGEDGAARVLDAHCTHLGAHLGHGGEVVGNCIRCPFHHWLFEGGGACVDIPYSRRKIPLLARMRSWPVVERDRAIFVWHDALGRDPQWPLPRVEDLAGGDFGPFHRIDRVARFHCQEIRENGVDPIHFATIHGLDPMEFGAEANGHVFHQSSRLQAPVGPRATEDTALDVYYYGLGYSMAHSRIGDLQILVLSYSTPLDAGRTHLRFALSVRRFESLREAVSLGRSIREAGRRAYRTGSLRRQLFAFWEGGKYRPAPGEQRGAVPGVLRHLVAGHDLRTALLDALSHAVAGPAAAELARQLDQDILVTENKTYPLKPLLREGEQTIFAMRRWAEQFYPEGAAAQSRPEAAVSGTEPAPEASLGVTPAPAKPCSAA